MDQEPLFFEGPEDAIAACLNGLNPKEVAAQVWPQLSLEQAAARLRALRNPDRRETADMGELIRLMLVTDRYYPLFYMAQEVNHSRPFPIAREDVKASLQNRAIQAVGELKQLVNKLERLSG